MDRLEPDAQLSVDEELMSTNTWVRLVLQGDGNLVLYRTQVGQALWASDTFGRMVSRVVMQGDGNLVAYSAQGEPLWDTGTYDHPGARLVLQDDGNLVIYDAAQSPLWDTGTVQNWNV